MKSPLLLLWASLCFAGQGIVLGPGQSVYNNSIPALSPGTPYRVEESLQNLPICGSGYFHTFNPGIVSANTYLNCLSGTDQRLYVCQGDNNGNCFQIETYGLPGGFVTFRLQHFPSSLTDVCQAWDVNGNQVFNATVSYSQENTYSNGASVGDGNGGGYAINYARIYSATVGVNSRPPVTADTATGLVFQWKFDGNLDDSGPGRYNGILSSGRASYVTTLGQSLVVPLMTNTNVSPSWPAPIPGYQPSWRAGQPAGLSCASSYSQSESASVSCFWQVLLHPGQTAPFWSDQTSQTPMLTGLVFGDYAVQLTVTDQAGDTATAVTHIGAVATDSNGLVVNANPAADAILGPMIAFGQNPWELGDYWHLAGSIQRYNQYISYGLSPTWPYATWEVMQTGTVSYNWTGVGMAPTYMGSTGTTLTAACSSSATSCTVADATSLQLSTLPARIYISSASSNRSSLTAEEIRVCAVSGTTPATLTFCYDGRGYADPSNGTRLAAQSWNAGDVVGNDPIVGSGTHFTSTLCPAGVPGPIGSLSYSAGTVALTAGSTAVALTGGTWSSATAANGYDLVVAATHSGTAFRFIAPISSLTNATNLILARPFPSDADTASSLTYWIVNPNVFLDLGYTVAQGFDPAVSFTKYWPTSYGCESDTLTYIAPYWDPGALASPPVTTVQPYTYQVGNWWYNQSSTGGLDFYSEDLANLAGWLRSGLKQFHDSSMMIGDIWIRQPQKSNGGNGSLLFYGGPVIGGVANAMLSDTGHGTEWKDIRSFALGGAGMASASFDCNGDDSREYGYAGAFLALAAEFDPDTTSAYAPGGVSWHQYWNSKLAQYAANEASCANQFGNTDNSWRTTFYGWPESQSAANAVTLTNGSTAGTGTGLSNKFCFGIAQASNVTVISGSSVVSGIGFPTTGWDRVAITGPGLVDRNGNSVPTIWVYATPDSSTQFTISFGATWPGNSSTTASVMFDNGSVGGDGVTSFMSFEADPMSQYEWSCLYNSSSSITLNRPWTGTNSTNYAYTSNVTGFAVQPFMLGIRQYAWLQGQQASATTQPAVSSEFASLRNDAGIFEHNIYDPVSGANYYALQPACNPITLASMGNAVCYGGYPPTGLPGANYSYTAERVNTIENSMSLTDYYVSEGGSPAAVAWGDLMYGNCMGNPAFTTGGVYAPSDGNTCDSSNGNLNASTGYGIGAGKWYGFFFGIGASWRWPAQRLGGVQAARPRAVFVGFDLGNVPSAASVQIVVTAPSGAQTSYACSVSPCRVTVDDRQGSHLYRMSYLSQSGHVLAQSQTGLLD
ncbi:MAG: hypothetical protein ABSH00_00380 [Bryobacteraceae bacterium]|jgi:hypothetical protein